MSSRTLRQRLPEAPVERSTAALSPTARKILVAAKKVLVRDGLEGLTLDAIAREAGVNKAATHYHFGSKAGLIEAIVDEIVLEECASMAHDVASDASLERRLDSLIDGVRRMATHPVSFGGFFDILPFALRTPALRARLARLYEVWFRWNQEWAGLGDPEMAARRDALEAMGRVIAAVVDGIAVQACIEGADYDPEPTLRALRQCLSAVLATSDDAQ